MVRWVFAGLLASGVLVACAGKSVHRSPGGGAGDAAATIGRAGGSSGSGGTGSEEDPSRGAAAGEEGSGGFAGTAVAPLGGGAGTASSAGTSSVAGSSDGGGAVGGAGGDLCAYPPVSVALNDWVDAEPQPTPSSSLARITKGMIGDWFGVVTTPWTDPYAVTLTFTKDNGYSAACVWSSNECCVAFNYGTDDDSELKRYDIEGVTLDGEGYGAIDIVFEYEDGYGKPNTRGTLEAVAVDATFDRMRFTFLHFGEYGPVFFDLQRQGEAPPK